MSKSKYSEGLTEAKLYSDGRPLTLLSAADEVVRAAHGPLDVRCKFVDADAPRRVEGRAGEPLEWCYHPAKIIAVNGRPPRGRR
jgi:hypothetical protein